MVGKEKVKELTPPPLHIHTVSSQSEATTAALPALGGKDHGTTHNVYFHPEKGPMSAFGYTLENCIKDL